MKPTLRGMLADADRIIGDLEQLIRDAEYWNGLPHNQQHTPMDVEPERLLLAQVRKARAEIADRLHGEQPRPGSEGT